LRDEHEKRRGFNRLTESGLPVRRQFSAGRAENAKLGPPLVTAPFLPATLDALPKR